MATADSHIQQFVVLKITKKNGILITCDDILVDSHDSRVEILLFHDKIRPKSENVCAAWLINEKSDRKGF